MSYYCELCNKSIQLKYKKRHLKSELHMDKETSIINKYIITNPELCQINDIVKNYVDDYSRKFVYYTVVSNWNLMFDNGVTMVVKSMKMYTFYVLHQNLEKYLKNKINQYKKEGLEFSHISEMNISFKTRLDHMTYKHYLEQPMPMVERLINKNSYKNYDLLKKQNDIDLTLHMGKIESRRDDIVYYSDEDE